MASTDMDKVNDGDNVCVVCFKNVEIFSIGSCDHAVCFECSTRMRILCKQNECPICRRELPKVIFTRKIEPYSSLFPKFQRSNLQDRKFGIIFSTLDIQKAYFRLLEHRCHMCKGTEQDWPFRTFLQLKDHMRREHELFYCDICSEHLKIFSFERRCYNRQELAYHRRKGDKNNTSHRGHPLCEFCDTRFMDNDELFRHLRRNHLFCHLCDADGKHQYYNSMDDLKRHFRDEHFLCEEGECKTMPLTAVFRTEIDFKAHLTVEHIKNMSKSATRQARTLELEFTMAPRPRSDIRSRRTNDRRDRFDDESSYYMEPGGPSGGPINNQPQMFVNPLTSEHFPALGGSSATGNASNVTLVSKKYTKLSNAAFNSDDFPSLGGSGPPTSRPTSAVTITANSAPKVTITRNVGQESTAGAPGITVIRKQKENFPALGGSSKQQKLGGSTVRLSVNSSNPQQPASVSIQVSQKTNGSITTTTHIKSNGSPSTSQAESFPALGTTSTPRVAQWVQPKPKKQEESKVAPCPVLDTPDLSSFPSLSKNDRPKKTSSVTVPVDSWVNLNTMKKAKKGDSVVKKEENRDTGGKSMESNSKGGGDGNRAIPKKGESSKKGANKVANNKAASDLEAKLDKIKFVEVSRPEETCKETDNKKPKKKKNKNSENDAKSAESNEKPTDSDKKQTKSEKKDENQNETQLNKNGITKKRSELKIGTLRNTNSPIGIDEFPALTSSSKPPPGFTKKPTNSMKPPPGFDSSNFPSLTVSNDLTFTNSSGQSYAIKPTKASAYYVQPSNFQSRNQSLIKKLGDILKDVESTVQFKTLSDEFRKGDVSAKSYYDKCRLVLGNKFEDIFPELLVLLPDIIKQQELYREISQNCRENLVACADCDQIIYRRELTEHYNHHRLENQFPSLGSSVQQINSSWRK